MDQMLTNTEILEEKNHHIASIYIHLKHLAEAFIRSVTAVEKQAAIPGCHSVNRLEKMEILSYFLL